MQVVELLCDWKKRGKKKVSIIYFFHFFGFPFYLFSRGFIFGLFNDIFVFLQNLAF
jgi:hypothetical protein